jgi:hypothetical protein
VGGVGVDTEGDGVEDVGSGLLCSGTTGVIGVEIEDGLQLTAIIITMREKTTDIHKRFFILAA